MVKIIEALKFNNKISLKSRLLLGIFLIIYLSFIVNQYQSSIKFGDKTSMYLIGSDEYSTRDKIVDVQQQTTWLFILPILIFVLKNRNIAYILTLLTIYLPIYINIFTILIFLFYFFIPLLIVISITLIWESKKNNVSNTNVPILILLSKNRILTSILILLIIALLLCMYFFGIIYIINYFLILLIVIFIILIWEFKKK